MKRTQLLLLCFVLICSCIPIIDKVAPTIQDFNNFRLSYRVQDTILLYLTYRDNDKLDSVTINVSRQVPPATSPWRYLTTKAIKGRRFEDTLRIPIPKDAPTGIYNLRVFVKDFAKLQAVPKDTIFELLADNRPPVIQKVTITSTGVGTTPQTDALGRFITCRASTIRLGGSGIIVDNLRVREVRISLNDITTSPAINLINTARVVSNDTIRLAGLFDQDIRVPNDVANGRTLQLVLTALDGEGNVSAPVRFNFVVNCDDQAPSFSILRTSPQIAPNRSVGIIEGSTFSILEAIATDETGLGSINITFNEVNQTRNTVFEQNLNGVKTIDVATLLATKPNLFQLPANAVAGGIFELVVTVRDVSGNTAQIFRVQLTVIRDEFPTIFVANAYIDNKEIRLGTTNLIARGQVLQIEGKVEEDRGLEYIRIDWGPSGQEANIVNLKGADITLPFDFADQRSVNKFRVPEQGTGSYTLIIRVKDLKNPEQIVRYTFRVN